MYTVYYTIHTWSDLVFICSIWTFRFNHVVQYCVFFVFYFPFYFILVLLLYFYLFEMKAFCDIGGSVYCILLYCWVSNEWMLVIVNGRVIMCHGQKGYTIYIYCNKIPDSLHFLCIAMVSMNLFIYYMEWVCVCVFHGSTFFFVWGKPCCTLKINDDGFSHNAFVRKTVYYTWMRHVWLMVTDAKLFI